MSRRSLPSLLPCEPPSGDSSGRRRAGCAHGPSSDSGLELSCASNSSRKDKHVTPWSQPCNLLPRPRRRGGPLSRAGRGSSSGRDPGVHGQGRPVARLAAEPRRRLRAVRRGASARQERLGRRHHRLRPLRSRQGPRAAEGSLMAHRARPGAAPLEAADGRLLRRPARPDPAELQDLGDAPGLVRARPPEARRRDPEGAGVHQGPATRRGGRLQAGREGRLRRLHLRRQGGT